MIRAEPIDFTAECLPPDVAAFLAERAEARLIDQRLLARALLRDDNPSRKGWATRRGRTFEQFGARAAGAKEGG